jgi:hypothetical protein
VNTLIVCEDEREETEAIVVEERANSVVVMISKYYAQVFTDNENRYGKKVVIYFGERLVKDYIKLPFGGERLNSGTSVEEFYDEEEAAWGGHNCLFPRAKYEFIFYE